MNANVITRLFSWTDAVFGVLPAVAVLLFADIIPPVVPSFSRISSAITFDATSMYPLTALMAGTMTSISMAVNMLAVQIWRKEWFSDMMNDRIAVYKLWLAMRQFTWAMASLMGICVFATFVEPASPISKYVVVLYIGWAGASIARMFRAIQYLHIMIAIAVTAISSIANDDDIEQ